MQEPLISVVLPVYNAGAAVRGCIESLIAQRYPRLEMIVVDDGSTDDSRDEAEKALSKSAARWKLIDLEHAGASVARNTGLRAAAGEWVAFVDSSDRVTPDFIGDLYETARKGRTTVAFCDLRYLDPACGRFGSHRGSGSVILPPLRAMRAFYTRKAMLTASGALYRTDFLRKNRIAFDERCHYLEGDFFIWQVLCHAGCITLLHEPLYDLVARPGSVTAITPSMVLTGYKALRRLDWRDLSRLGAEFPLRKQICARWVVRALRSAARSMSEKKFRYLYEVMDARRQAAGLFGTGSLKLTLCCAALLPSPGLSYRLMRVFQRRRADHARGAAVTNCFGRPYPDSTA